MAKGDAFLQFPVSALQMRVPLTEVNPEQMRQRLAEILDYCIVEVGQAFVKKQTEEAIEAIVDDSPYRPDRQLTKHETAVLVGMKVLGVGYQNDYTIGRNDCKTNWSFIRNQSANQKQVRLRLDFYWDIRKRVSDLSWREFSVLCGLYAGIGARAVSRLSFRYIGALASGYSRLNDMPPAIEPPPHLIRHTVRKLEARGFVASLCQNQRHTFYSNKLDYTGMCDLLVAKQIEKRETEKQKALRLLKERLAALEPKRPTIPPKPPGGVRAQNRHPHEGTGNNGDATTEARRQKLLRELGQ
jgi:hypothetical protein